MTDTTDVRVWTWLPGDFDPRSLHRRSGRALWRYRGAHRSGAWTVAQLVHAVERQRDATAAQHRRSLRRPVEPIVYLGSRWTSLRFYGVPPAADDGVAMTATLTKS